MSTKWSSHHRSTRLAAINRGSWGILSPWINYSWSLVFKQVITWNRARKLMIWRYGGELLQLGTIKCYPKLWQAQEDVRQTLRRKGRKPGSSSSEGEPAISPPLGFETSWLLDKELLKLPLSLVLHIRGFIPRSLKMSSKKSHIPLQMTSHVSHISQIPWKIF